LVRKKRLSVIIADIPSKQQALIEICMLFLLTKNDIRIAVTM
jgi:hypothetical protein